jgi:trehalose synthase
VIEADVPSLSPESFKPLLGTRSWRRFTESLSLGRSALEGRTLWHLSSTVTGGGVAELLASVLGYLKGAEVSSRWIAIDGSHDFFVVTKRLHHMLHGKEGDGGPLGETERRRYEEFLFGQLPDIAALLQPGDVVVLHDPQVAGLAPALRDAGATLVWNCHIGSDDVNDLTQRAWSFLMPFVSACDAVVFSCARHVWRNLDGVRVAIVPPCIDAFSPKNAPLGARQVKAILAATGIVPGGGGGEPMYTRRDGTPARITWTADVIEEAPVPPTAPIVSQVSRWDPLKDHAGVAATFAQDITLSSDAHLVLAGPSPQEVTDDPEGSATLAELKRCWADLPSHARCRVHIACLPMADVEENAVIVNALQRRSQVVVQKSLAEGFGLTVAEALWKERPTVASAVGGITEQITDGENGVLVDSPDDHSGFAKAIAALLEDPDLSRRLGHKGKTTVKERFLAPAYLGAYLPLVASLVKE